MKTSRHIFAVLLSVLLIAWSGTLRAADVDRLREFLDITGFGVALESIKLAADSAPQMIGISPEAFGGQWPSLVDDVFDPSEMERSAIDMLSQTLEPELLDHAVAFYGSEFGRKIVAAENASHLVEDDALKQESGEAIVAGLVRIGSARLSELKRLNRASGSADASVHAIQEIQVRFLMAAATSGIIDLRMDEADLRASIEQQEGELRRSMQTSALANSAYTYQAFSDEEIVAYADALSNPQMQRVYELMNAVQFQIMANRFEALALRLEGLKPSQDL